MICVGNKAEGIRHSECQTIVNQYAKVAVLTSMNIELVKHALYVGVQELEE